jgi:hypothetical protein
MSILLYEIRLLDAEICKKLCVFAHIASKFNSGWLITHFRDYLVGDEETPLGQEEVQKIKNRILEQFPADYTQKVPFHLDDLVVGVGVLCCRVKTLSTGILHLNKLSRYQQCS